MKILFAVLWLFYGMTAAAAADSSLLKQLRIPKGFTISVYARDIPGARSLALGEMGTVFVGTRTSGNVYALHKGKTFVIASNLNMPNGVAFYHGSLYVAEVNRVLRFDKIEDHLTKPPAPVVLVDSLPKDRHHGWKIIAFGPDHKIYLPVGAPCNVCLKKDPRYASILRMDLDGKNIEVYARGIRNSVGMDWDPRTGELWFSDNGRDWMGDDKPADELNHAVKADENFGFPFCHAGDILDPDFGKGKKCSDYVAPVLKVPAHSALLGIRFYTGHQFPEEYRQNIFMAEHGSWNRSSPVGYRVSRARVTREGNLKSYDVFLAGFLSPQGKILGRPVDILVMPDGGLLVSDDMNGAIYKISYHGK